MGNFVIFADGGVCVGGKLYFSCIGGRERGAVTLNIACCAEDPQESQSGEVEQLIEVGARNGAHHLVHFRMQAGGKCRKANPIAKADSHLQMTCKKKKMLKQRAVC